MDEFYQDQEPLTAPRFDADAADNFAGKHTARAGVESEALAGKGDETTPGLNDASNPPLLSSDVGRVASDVGCGTSDEPCHTSHITGHSSYFPVREIAQALGVSKPTARKRARDEQWPVRGQGNREEFAPPPHIASQCTPRIARAEQTREPAVTFTELKNGATRTRALCRERAVQHLRMLLSNGVPKEMSLSLTVVWCSQQEDFQRIGLTASANALRTWDDQHRRYGLNGLVDQRQGNNGKRAMEIPEEFRKLGMALAIERGSVARAARDLMRHPDLPASMREHVHEGHASKSYVTPSLRKAITPAPIVADVLQGLKHTRVNSLASIHAVHDFPPGAWFMADDMTPNAYVWEPWPGPLGYRVGRPQILKVSDVASLLPLKAIGVMRASGAYTSDDIAAVMGSVFDAPGLPNVGVVFEGNIWQCNKVRGHKTGVSDEDRIGGLASLGLQMRHARTPGAKWEIEGSFNIDQHIMDRCPGFCGRNERDTLPEKLKRQLREAETGKTHPRTFLLSLDQFMDHVQASIAEFANERQDGKTLRGSSPLEFWRDHAPVLRVIPDHAKWIYRSAFSKTVITRHGVRVQQGSGRFTSTHYYHNPALLEARRGQTVAVYWNDRLPESDAAILSIAGNRREFIGMAQHVPEIGRLHATREEKDAAFATKREQLAYARAVIKDITPHLVRGTAPVLVDAQATAMGERLAQAAETAQTQRAEAERTAERVQKISTSDVLARRAAKVGDDD